MAAGRGGGVSQLFERLKSDLNAALKARDTARVAVLRMLVSKVKDLQIERGRDEALSDEQVQQVLKSYAKQRQEAADVYKQAGRDEMHAQEMRERDVVVAYLPQQLGDDELRAVLRDVVAETGATSARDIGKVMGPAMKRLQGRADGTRVQRVVRELLGG
jgi:uncharacterized protein YqeY